MSGPPNYTGGNRIGGGSVSLEPRVAANEANIASNKSRLDSISNNNISEFYIKLRSDVTADYNGPGQLGFVLFEDENIRINWLSNNSNPEGVLLVAAKSNGLGYSVAFPQSYLNVVPIHHEGVAIDTTSTFAFRPKTIGLRYCECVIDTDFIDKPMYTVKYTDVGFYPEISSFTIRKSIPASASTTSIKRQQLQPH